MMAEEKYHSTASFEVKMFTITSYQKNALGS